MPMRPTNLLIILFACFALLAAIARAESGDNPNDYFLNAYTSFQKASQIESTGSPQAALQSYRETLHILDQISKRWPNWEREIVDFRRKKTQEAIARLGEKGSPEPGPSVNEGGGNSSGLEPALPADGALVPSVEPSESGTSRRKSPKSAPPASVPSDPVAAIQQKLKELTETNDRQKNELEKLQRERDTYEKQAKEAEAARKKADEQRQMVQDRSDLLEKKLAELRTKGTGDAEAIKALQVEREKVRQELRNLQIEREAADEVRQQNATRLGVAAARAQQLEKERNDAKKLSAEAAAQIKAAQDKADASVKDAQQKMNEALKDRDTYKLKLTKVTQERDDALQQIQKFKEAQKQVDKLVTDNTHLMAQLADAEKQITDLKSDGQQKDAAIADLKKEVGSVKQQLADAKKQSAEYQTHMGDLQAKLDETQKNLATMKTDNAASVAEKKKMQEENDILRGIVLREMKEQARRDQTRKLVLDEMKNLESKSTELGKQSELLKQISYLGQPVVKLTPKERALFKKPQVEIGDNEISLAAPKADDAGETAANASASPDANAAPSDTKPADANLPATASATTEPALPATATPPSPAPAPEAPKTTITAAPPAHPADSAKTPESKPASTADTKPETKSQPAKQDKIAKASPPEEQPHSLSLETPAMQALTGAPGTDVSASLSISPSSPTTSPSKSKRTKSPDDEALPSKSAGGQLLENAPAKSGTTKGGGSTLPGELTPLMAQAKDEFERGNYRDAEKLYGKILEQAPENLNALDNLGVVRFRSGKLKMAEETFKKAIAIAPEDAFSHCTLGIVFYSQARYDDAVNELTKALAINPSNATAHNYLGITASNKGWQEAAQKELETAISLDRNYADAYFNIAVVFATQQPPNKELARKNYKRAIELGAEPDSSLEQLLK